MKTAIITGGTKGIGEAIARAFVGAGMRVVIGARKDNGLAKKLGSRARFIAMDVRFEDAHNEAIKVARQWTGRLDVYINCAGFSGWKPIVHADDDFVNEMLDTNLKGTVWGCKVAAQNLSKGGAIINVPSIAGKRGSANNSIYCASKFGVTGLTQSLAKELGPKGIRVNAVCPVYVETRGLAEALKDGNSPSQGKNIKSYLKKFALEQSALKRLPKAGEVAKTCLFLASDQASAITGQSINVDCGVLPQ